MLGVTATPNPVLVSNAILYSIDVTNSGLTVNDVFLTNAISGPVIFNGVTNNFGIVTTNSEGFVFFLNTLFGNQVARVSLNISPIQPGSFTNHITVAAFGRTSAHTNAINQVNPLSADLAVGMTNATSGVIAGGSTTIGLTVTNGGAGSAAGVVVTNTLPPSFGLLSVTPTNASTTFNNGVLIWTIGALTNGEIAQLLASVRPTNGGTFNLTASVGSSTMDSSTNNNTVTNSMAVDEVVSTNLVITAVTPQQFNPQTGLMEHVVTVRNDGTNAVPATRLFVIGLGTNRLYNAAGTNNIGTNSNIPYVQHNAALAVGASVPMRLEYHVRTRTPLTNLTYIAVGVTFTPPTVPTSTSPIITAKATVPSGFLIEFQSIPGRSYTILYADNMSFSNALAAQPVIVAPADRVQWIDSGPPKTISVPASVGSRFYRVMLNP